MRNFHFKVIQALLLFNTDVTVKGKRCENIQNFTQHCRGYTALHSACEEGNVEKIKFLLELPKAMSLLGAMNRNNETALVCKKI